MSEAHPDPDAPLAGLRLLLALPGADGHAAALAAAGADVTPAPDGLAALTAWQRSETDGRPFDLALFAEHLPALSGPTVTTWLRRGGFRGVIVGLASRDRRRILRWRAWGADLVVSADRIDGRAASARLLPLVAAAATRGRPASPADLAPGLTTDRRRPSPPPTDPARPPG